MTFLTICKHCRKDAAPKQVGKTYDRDIALAFVDAHLDSHPASTCARRSMGLREEILVALGPAYDGGRTYEGYQMFHNEMAKHVEVIIT